MGSPGAEWKLTKRVELNGVGYDITVSKDFNENCRAVWMCTSCAEEGAWAPVSGTPAGVLDLAKICISTHHALLHGRPPSVKPK